MKLIIDDKACNKASISVSEAVLLLIVVNGLNIETAKTSLLKKGYITGIGDINRSGYRATKLGINAIDSVVTDSIETKEEDRYETLANKLRELYPPGRKEGTNYMWKGTTAEIARKLKTLVVKYHYNFTDEEAIKATETYIKSFNGNYRLMRLLKYFILKAEKDEDGNTDIKSELMNYIENAGQEELLKEDWISSIV